MSSSRNPELHGWTPSKEWGQNYLVNQGIVQKIVDLIPPDFQGRIIEIGSGKGSLTKALIPKAAHLLAIEPHPESAMYLRSQMGMDPRFELLEKDATCLDFAPLMDGAQTFIVGNLPYCVAARILFQLVLTARGAAGWTLMFQREVAQRIVAPPKGKEYGLLSVISQLSSSCRLCFHVQPGSFFPVPQVTSSVVHFQPFPERSLDWQAFSRWLSRLFSMRRKQLGTILAAVLPPDRRSRIQDSLDIRLRPEQLTPEEHLELFLQLNG